MRARVRRKTSSLTFRLRLTPRGGRDAIDGWARGIDGTEYLKVRVVVAPEDGKANAALVALLSKSLGIAKSAICVASGRTARLKTIKISPATDSVLARLETMETAK